MRFFLISLFIVTLTTSCSHVATNANTAELFMTCLSYDYEILDEPLPEGISPFEYTNEVPFDENRIKKTTTKIEISGKERCILDYALEKIVKEGEKRISRSIPFCGFHDVIFRYKKDDEKKYAIMLSNYRPGLKVTFYSEEGGIWEINKDYDINDEIIYSVLIDYVPEGY